MATEYWDLWDEDRAEWQDWMRAIADGLSRVMARYWSGMPGVDVLVNRWDVPGFDVVVPPGAIGIPADPAWRTVQVYLEVLSGLATIRFGGAAWFDEQGPAPQEPWTRWWCHTTPEDEADWAMGVRGVPDPVDEIEQRIADVVNVTGGWQWGPDFHRWEGARMRIEDPVTYSSVAPGRRIE